MTNQLIAVASKPTFTIQALRDVAVLLERGLVGHRSGRITITQQPDGSIEVTSDLVLAPTIETQLPLL